MDDHNALADDGGLDGLGGLGGLDGLDRLDGLAFDGLNFGGDFGDDLVSVMDGSRVDEDLVSQVADLLDVVGSGGSSSSSSSSAFFLPKPHYHYMVIIIIMCGTVTLTSFS